MIDKETSKLYHKYWTEINYFSLDTSPNPCCDFCGSKSQDIPYFNNKFVDDLSFKLLTAIPGFSEETIDEYINKDQQEFCLCLQCQGWFNIKYITKTYDGKWRDRGLKSRHENKEIPPLPFVRLPNNETIFRNKKLNREKDEKIQQYVKRVLPLLVEEDLISDEELENLQSSLYSRKTFRLDYPLLESDANSIVYNGVSRYYKKDLLKIKDKDFFICSQWWIQYNKTYENYINKWIERLLIEKLKITDKYFLYLYNPKDKSSGELYYKFSKIYLNDIIIVTKKES